MANSIDPDQTAPVGAVWSGSTLFAHTYLSEYLALIFYTDDSFFFFFFFFLEKKWKTNARFHQENLVG